MTKQKSNGLGVSSLILGIMSIVLGWVPILGLGAGIVGIVLSNKQKKIYPNGIATGGMVTSIIGVIFSGIYTLFLIIVLIFVGTGISGMFP